MTGRVLAVLGLALYAAGAEVAQSQVLPPSGELRAGDRILLRVDSEPQLSDTFTVTQGPAVELPGLGSVPLAGVRRADVEKYLGEWIGRYLKRADVRAKALVRLSIVGEVDKPGFYAVPADLVMTDALMVTGGPTRDAKVKALRIERDGFAVWRGGLLQRALGSGYTVDQLGLRDGDQIVFPRESRSGVLPYIGVMVAIPAAIYATVQMFRP